MIMSKRNSPISQLPLVPFKRADSPDYHFISFGPDIENIIGYSVSMLLGHNESDEQNYTGIIYEDDIEDMKNIIASASSTGKSYITEYRIKIRDGAYRRLREYGSRYNKDENGQMYWDGMILTLEDDYQNLFEKVPVGLYVTNSKEQIVDMNTQLMNIIGIENKEDLVGKDILDFYVNPKDRLEWQKQLKLNGSVQYMETKWRSCYGRDIWVLETATLIEDSDGQQYCEVSVEDITTRKEAESAFYKTYMKLESANKDLNNRTVWMNSLNAFSFDIVRKLDFDSAINIIMTHLSNNFEHVFACTMLVNWDHNFFKIGHIDCRSAKLLEKIDINYDNQYSISNPEKSFLLAEKGRALVLEIDTIGIEEAGTEFYSLLQGLRKNGLKAFVLIPFYKGSKQIGQLFMGYRETVQISENENYFLTCMADYTAMLMENLRLYKKLKKSYEHLKRAQDSMKKQERFKAMGQMASGVTHDINNTLAPITLYTEALLDTEPGLSDRARRYLHTIQNAVNDIENVTQRLRIFYKQDEQQISESIVVDQLYNELIELTRPRWETMPNRQGKVIKIMKILDDQQSEIVGVRSDIREALLNCVFNAVDAMPEGGTIKLLQRQSEDFYILSVIDNGSGMTEEQVRHCQEPFYTTKGAAGTGLGLSGVYGMIQRHVGQLEIESRAGEGTSINLYFPKKDIKNTPDFDNIPKASIPSAKILCVDSDPVMLDSLSEMLTIDGHEVETAKNGKEALSLFYERFENKDGFKVVITDLGMPEMDGNEFAAQIKKIDPDIPVMLLSGWESQLLQNNISLNNIDVVLSKPPRMKLLRSALDAQIFKKC